jgi:hypothetical protein
LATFLATSIFNWRHFLVVVSPTSESGPTDSLLQPDFGLFEASHLACPVLPQYHPKQLMELLNSGKIRWVKAILAHLVFFRISCRKSQTPT